MNLCNKTGLGSYYVLYSSKGDRQENTLKRQVATNAMENKAERRVGGTYWECRDL